MRVLVFGANGQLGRSLKVSEPEDVSAVYIDRNECDLSVAGAVDRCLEQYRADVVINAAAYTAVDRAEEETALAERINGDAVGEMAEWVRRNGGARFLHVSTDFVFDGLSDKPYLPGDQTGPLGVYGASKLSGERQALKAAPEQTMILRTAWVYSEYGSNFVRTMLRLMAERDELSVVADQSGSPTYALSLAEIIWLIVCDEAFMPGIYHWTDQGNISWHEFALAIQGEALDAGRLSRKAPVHAITTEEYPTPAERPSFSVLDTSKLGTALGIEPTPWLDNLQRMMARL